MTRHVEIRVVDRPPEAVFDLVADVERYPEFLPLWQEAVVAEREEGAYETDQVVGLGLIRQAFHSRTVMERPRRIDVTSSQAPFRRFEIHWRFRPAQGGGTRVQLALDCDVASPYLASMMDAWLSPMATAMVTAFEQRARTLIPAPQTA